MRDGLPANWVESKLEDCCLIIQGQSPPGDTYNEDGEGLPFFQGKAEFGDLYPTVRKWCTSPTKIAEQDDVLVSVRAPVGPTNLSPGTSCIGRGLAAIRPLEGSIPRYILYAIRHSVTELKENATGSTFEAISGDQLRSHRIRLAPANEQQRVVAEIEKQFTRLDAAVAALKRVQANLKRYRAAVLKAACEGHLVPTEAEVARNEGRSYDTGEQLLARILKERRAKWEAKQLAKMKASGKSPNSDDWKKKYKKPEPPQISDPPILPEGWIWASIDQIVKEEPYALAIGPFGSNLKVSDYTESGVPLVFVKNIRSRNFDDSKFVSISKARELFAHRVDPGDVLVTKMGAPPGDVAIYPASRSYGIITADCIKVRCHDDLVSRFVALMIESELVRKQLAVRTKGVAQLKVSLARFRNVGLPMAPGLEQKRIVDAFEYQAVSIGVLEESVKLELARADRLRQSVLKLAFEGKLVPQDPNDEPASALLDRIKASRLSARTRAVSNRRKPEQTTMSETKKPRSVVEVLRERKTPLTPEQLFKMSGHDVETIDDFYAALKSGIEAGEIIEKRSGDDAVRLQAE